MDGVVQYDLIALIRVDVNEELVDVVQPIVLLRNH